MQALASASASSLDHSGVPGDSDQGGNRTEETLAGQKLSDLNCLFKPYLSSVLTQSESRSMAIIKELSKGGGKAVAAIRKSMPSSDAFTTLQSRPPTFSTHNPYPVATTQQMDPPEASTRLLEAYSHPLSSRPSSRASSLTMTHLSSTMNSILEESPASPNSLPQIPTTSRTNNKQGQTSNLTDKAKNHTRKMFTDRTIGRPLRKFKKPSFTMPRSQCDKNKTHR
jgi:hypothetical protein